MKTPPLRRPLAILFCDIAGTTAMIAEVGDLVISTVLNNFYEQSDRLSRERDCASMKFIGDGFLAAFEDPGDVVPLARAIQERFRVVPALGDRPLRFRFSLHFADVLCVATSYGNDILGEEVNIAAHLNDLTQPGQIVISQTAFDRIPAEQQALAGPAEAIDLRMGRTRTGAATPIAIHRIALLVP